MTKQADLEAAFAAGWRAAARWADRKDLLADIGSPAYRADMGAALESSAEPSAPYCTCPELPLSCPFHGERATAKTATELAQEFGPTIQEVPCFFCGVKLLDHGRADHPWRRGSVVTDIDVAVDALRAASE